MKLDTELFIGSLTEVPEKEIEEVLKDAKHEMKTQRFSKIKVAIAPNLINKEMLKLFKKYNVSTIELEV